MKMNFKHVAATALAVAMSLSLASPALAADPEATPTPVTSGSLTVTGHELTDKNVFAVRMFTARAFDGTEEGPNYSYDSYTLEEKWLPFFEATIDPGVTAEEYGAAGIDLPEKPTGDDYKKAAVKYLEWLAGEDNTEPAWAAFAEDAQDWLYKQDPAVFTVSGQNVMVGTGWDTLAYFKKATKMEDPADNLPTGTATFGNLPTGYYVVFPEGGSTGNDGRNTDAMLINIPTDADGATWNIKSTYPTVDKKVDTNITEVDSHDDATDNGSAQVGDTVTFTLTSKVPDMSDYTTFYFAFNDTLSNGLLFVQKQPDPATVDKSDVTVTIGGKTVTEGYTVSLEGSALKVVFDDLKTVKAGEGTSTPVAAGDEIVVTYQAMITEAAATTNPATNTVEVEYSNDPKEETTGTSTPDTSTVYTYDIDVNKWAEDIVDGINGNLAGAQFQLTTDEDGKNIVKLIGSGNSYRVAKPDEDGAVDSFTTTSTGDINIAGLKAGTYYLHEIAAPTGYNKLKDPITIVITMDNDPNPGDATITVDNEPATGSDGTTVNVLNKKGITLPETGGIGTIGLTIAGVAIVLIGVFAPRKKKSNQE